MRRVVGLCLVCLLSCLEGLAVPRAARTARVDAAGVMRWDDDGSEVALFGVNYYAPFTVDYQMLTNRGLSVSQVMREDVAHFRRLGVDCLRIHTFDRQFSTRDGAFLANRHIALLDELIDLCARNGIYTVLTPIAWWGGAFAPEQEGFSARWTMREMTTNRDAWKVQARFLKAFAEHVNTVTGRRYGDDPAVLCFELINEPLYPPDHPDEAVTEYINVLADGLRASGTKKPIFYNSWHGRNAAAGAARIDGVTGSAYPGGLASGRARRTPQMAILTASTLRPDASIAHKARMIYEFDCPDTPHAYAYPAMAQIFRHEGVQVAAQFQYDALPLAADNRNWKTHDLNLVYTPAKALSLTIGAEVFRRIPRGCARCTNAAERLFPPFRLNAAANLAQMVTETDYLYTADPLDPPPAPERLRRIWGVGASPVAASTGNGAYFLDKAQEGVWRLQLYPSLFEKGDVYSYDMSARRIVLSVPIEMKLALPDLGPSFRVRRADAADAVVAVARSGRVTLPPGDYVVEHVADYGEAERLAVARLETPPYHAPPAAVNPTGVAISPVPDQWRADYPWTLNMNVLGATNIVVTVQTAAGDQTHRFPVRSCRAADEWNFLEAARVLATPYRGVRGVRRYAARDDQGVPAVGMAAKAGAFDRADRKGCAIMRGYCEAASFRRLFGAPGRGRAVLVRARATQPETKLVELVFVGEDRGCWGVNLPLTTAWQTIRVPLAELRPFWKTKRGDGTVPDMSRLAEISIGFGDWLYRGTLDRPHGFEISSIKVEY